MSENTNTTAEATATTTANTNTEVITTEPSLIKTIIELLKTGIDIVKLGLSLSKDCLELTVFVGRLALDEISIAVKAIKNLELADVKRTIELLADIANGDTSGTNKINFERKSLNNYLADFADFNA